MRRYLSGLAVAAACLVTSPAPASAQDGFVVGYSDIGPVIGLGGLGGADYSLGGRFETGFRSLPNLNDGILGIGVGVNYWTYDYDDFFLDNNSLSYLAVDVTANYHFNLTNKKWDPFVGAGLGYRRVSTDLDDDCDAFGFNCDFDDAGIYFIGHAGIRYFMQPKLALYADVGAGASNLNVGVMFRFR